MKYLVILLTMGFVSESALAALSIKPGLWTVQSILKRDGQEIDAGKMMKEAMAKMSPEQRKQMEAMMAKMGGEGGPAFRMGDNGMQVCYTKELLKNEEMLNQHKDQNCTSSFPVKTPTQLIVEFKCKNGTSGKADWQVKNSTHYTGKVTVNEKSGKSTLIDYKAEFTSADCGAVKPLSPALLKK